MDKVKPGIRTSEFWIAAIVDVVAAVMGILAIRGLVSPEEGNLYVVLASAIVAAVAPIVMAFTTGKYIQGRALVKAAASK